MDTQAIEAWRMDEKRVQRAATYKADQDRWMDLARFAMEQVRRIAREAAEWLELEERGR